MYIYIYDILQKKQTTGIKTDQWLSRVMGGQERVIKNRQHDRILGDDGIVRCLDCCCHYTILCKHQNHRTIH